MKVKSPKSDIMKFSAENLAINSNSKYRELCWDFMKIYTSNKGINENGFGGGYLYVNKGRLERNLKWADRFGKSANPNFELNIEEDERIKSNKLKYVDVNDALVESIILEAEPFLNEEISIEDTVNKIENKLIIYINE